MHAQKREVEIRRRVHVTADQVGTPGPQLGIVSAEWDDAHVAGQGARQPIGVEPRTIEHDARFARSVDVITRAADVPPGSTIRRTATPNSTRAPAARASSSTAAT